MHVAIIFLYLYLSNIIQIGRNCNIISSHDIEKIEIKLNRRHSQVTNFSEWGIAEIGISDIPETFAPKTEIWLPVLRRTSGEQIGVILVEIGKILV